MYKQEFNGSVPETGDTSSDVTCTLARNGDLVQEIYVKAKVNAMIHRVEANLTVVDGDRASSANTIHLASVPADVTAGKKVTFNKPITVKRYKDDITGTIVVDTTTDVVETNQHYIIDSLTGNDITLLKFPTLERVLFPETVITFHSQQDKLQCMYQLIQN